MSLIHEALKKVESQRRRGQAPTLDSPRFQKPRRRSWRLWALLGLIVLLGAAWYWQADFAPAPQSEIAKAERQAAATPPVSSATAPDGKDSRAREAGTSVAAAPSRTSADSRAGTETRVTAARADAVTERQPERVSREVAAARARGTARTSAAAGAGSGPTRQTERVADVGTAGPRATRVRPAHSGTRVSEPQQPIKPPPRSKAARAQANQRQQALPPMYWDLPYAQRSDIPDMHISIHMYAKDPADRFVIIDGVRYVEGDSLPDDIELVRINPDSVTMRVDGQAFRLPRQGTH